MVEILMSIVMAGLVLPLHRIMRVTKNAAEAGGGGPFVGKAGEVPSGRRQKTVAIEMVKDDQPESDDVIRFVASTGRVDRDGDIIVPEGIKTDDFDSNPRFLYMHDPWHLPAGKVVNYLVDERGFVIDVKFVRSEDFPNPSEDVKRALDMARMYQLDLMSAVSIGFSPVPGMVERREEGGYIFREIDLLEISGVTVPANPDATMVQRSAEAPELVLKWAKEVLGERSGPDGDSPLLIGVGEYPSQRQLEGLSEAMGRKVCAIKGLQGVWDLKEGRTLSQKNVGLARSIATDSLVMLSDAGEEGAIKEALKNAGWVDDDDKQADKTIAKIEAGAIKEIDGSDLDGVVRRLEQLATTSDRSASFIGALVEASEDESDVVELLGRVVTGLTDIRATTTEWASMVAAAIDDDGEPEEQDGYDDDDKSAGLIYEVEFGDDHQSPEEQVGSNEGGKVFEIEL